MAGPPSVSGALAPVDALALLRAERLGAACNVRSGGARLPRPKPRDGAFILTLPGIAQFTGSAFGSAAIWQYESLKSRVQTYFEEARADWLDKIRPQKRGDFRKQVHGARLSLLAHGWVPGPHLSSGVGASASTFIQQILVLFVLICNLEK